jgi:hypothetical protein
LIYFGNNSNIRKSLSRPNMKSAIARPRKLHCFPTLVIPNEARDLGLLWRRQILRIVLVLSALSSLGACGSSNSSRPAVIPPPTPEIAETRLSTDSFTNPESQHATEVEPGAFAFGSTIVTAFQVGRIFGGGASDIGFATSTNSGASWTNGLLPGTTVFQGGTFSAISDPAVAFDAAHNIWMISSLLIAAKGKVAVSRSTDGLHWGNPIVVSATPDADKNWVVCDNTSTSPFFGHCYVEWDDPGAQDLIWMSTSTDGGLTWQPALNTADSATGIGGVPQVQPNGTVVVPIEGIAGSMLAFISSDGGASWASSTTISSIIDHLVAGSLRTDALPASAVDASGKVYVVWQDCRFRTACASNDLVMSTSTDGIAWSAPIRIPIDPTSSTVDHFLPGLGIDPATSGNTAHLGLTFYSYAVANCSAASCALNASFISSPDGGSTWTPATLLAGPMTVSWLPNTFAGFMVGDYMSTVFSGGKAFPIFTVARANSGTTFDQAIFTTATGFAVSSRARAMLRSKNETVVPGAHPDHPPKQYYDLDHEHRIRPPKKRR